MNTVSFRMLIAAAAVSVVALGPAAGMALGDKPQAGQPSHGQVSRYARGDNRGQGNGAQGQSRGRGDDARGGDRGRGGDDRYDDRRGGDRDGDGDRRYDDRSRDSRHYVRPVYQPARSRPVQHRPPTYKHYTYHDTRWHHRHFYPPRGYYYPYAPPGAVPVYYNRYRYYYGGGIWYAPRGLGWAVVTPPLGIFVSLLPPCYSTVWFGGVPHYYANDAYYVWRERERAYQVVEPPYGARAMTVSPAAEDIDGRGYRLR